MNIKACPKCASKNVILYAAGITGNYKCLDCGYIGPLIIESEEKLKLDSNIGK